MNITISKFSFEIDDKYNEYPLDYVTDECRKILEDEVGIPMKYIEKNCDEDYIRFVIKTYFAKHEIASPFASEPVVEEPVAEEAPTVEETPVIEDASPAPVEEAVEETVAEAPAPVEEAVEETVAEAPAPVEEVVEETVAEAPAPVEEVVEEAVAEAPAPVEEVVEEAVAEAPAPVEEVVEETVAEAPAPIAEVVTEPEAKKSPEVSLEQFKNLTLSILLMNEDKRRSLFGTSDTVEILKRNTAEQIAEKFAIFTCSCGMDICYIEANIPAGEKFEIKCPKCGMPHLRKKKAVNQGISIVSA